MPGEEEESVECNFCHFYELINNIIRITAFGIVPILAGILLLVGGVYLVASFGSPERVQTGKKILTGVLIGVIIVYVAYAIIAGLIAFLAPGDTRFNLTSGGFEINCTAPIVTPSPSPGPSPGPVPATSTPPVTCPQSGQNLCTPLSTSCFNSVSSCAQYSSIINQVAQSVPIPSVNTGALLRSIMVNESSCNISSQSSQGACGLMQLKPSTANQFKTQCGITGNIDCNWLKNPANAEASVCITARFLRSLTLGGCGTFPLNIAAGYNAGAEACQTSQNCQGESGCTGAKKKWECLYDDNDHQVCNTGYNETRDYVRKVSYCYTI